VIDLRDVTAGANATIGYTGSNSPGTLTVSDGTITASIVLLGSYSLANFTTSSDGHGGTLVVDPPLPDSQNSNSLAMPAASLGVLNQQMSLLTQHMASAFPTAGSADGGLSAAGPSEGVGGQRPSLVQPVTNQNM
jgi:large repetitive protein